MKKLCIVPFTDKEYSLVKYLCREYIISALVSPKGIGTSGTDVGILRNVSETGYTFTNSISQGIFDSDIVLVSNVSEANLSLYAYAIKALDAAVKSRKEILCFLDLKNEEKEEYEKRCTNQGNHIHFLHSEIQDEHFQDEQIMLFKMGVPVLYISETIRDCGGYDVFLQVIDRLQKDGKRVLALSEDSYNVLFSQQVITFWHGTSPSEMVYRVNHKVYSLVKKFHPDVIVIKLPEPMMKYDDENPFDFGLTAFLVSQAVPGDGHICCTCSGTPYVGFWDNVNENFSAKFGYQISAVNVSNQRLDGTRDSGIATLYVQKDKISPEILLLNQYNSLPFYQMSESNSFEQFYQDVLVDMFDIPYGVI